MMIYVPDITHACYVVIDNQTIRAYEINPNENMGIPINYHDYFVNSHYLSRDNSEIISSTVNCIDQQYLTNDWYYRNDLPDILIIIVVMCVFIISFPIQIITRLTKRFQ